MTLRTKSILAGCISVQVMCLMWAVALPGDRVIAGCTAAFYFVVSAVRAFAWRQA